MFYDIIHSLGHLIRQNLQQVVLGITAVTLVLAGPPINSFLRKFTNKLHVILRYLIFVLVCTGGYGFLAHVLYRGIKSFLVIQNDLNLTAWTVGVYLVLAWIAKQENHI